ncbi:MAG: hypothetical protein AAF933_02835 [Pseudomonadota bacterium]
MNKPIEKRVIRGTTIAIGLAWTAATVAFLALYAWSWTWVL